MIMKLGGNLSKREHQIMDLAYEREGIGSGELEDLLPGKPSNSAIRVHLRSLESKGFLTHTGDPGKYTYHPTSPRDAVARIEIGRLVRTFFGGSVTAAVSTLLDQERDRLTPDDIAELQVMIKKAAKEGR
jgi:predicted transcriptional regulator